MFGKGNPIRIVAVDCGLKNNVIRLLVKVDQCFLSFIACFALLRALPVYSIAFLPGGQINSSNCFPPKMKYRWFLGCFRMMLMVCEGFLNLMPDIEGVRKWDLCSNLSGIKNSRRVNLKETRLFVSKEQPTQHCQKWVNVKKFCSESGCWVAEAERQRRCAMSVLEDTGNSTDQCLGNLP